MEGSLASAAAVHAAVVSVDADLAHSKHVVVKGRSLKKRDVVQARGHSSSEL